MDGTTGYDALALLDRVLTDPAGQPALDALESRLRGGPSDWAQLVHDRKLDVATGACVPRPGGSCASCPTCCPSRPSGWRTRSPRCWRASRSTAPTSPTGRAHLDEAVESARAHRPDLADVLDVLAPVLGDPDQPAALRFQQTSGMVMAKGVEDCAFYRSSRLTSLNEVGADPSIFAITPEEWHEAMVVRQRDWPNAMTTLTTHDTKRGEDVRARLAVLAEIPDLWEQSLDRLLSLVPLPDPGFGSLLWQAILGVWPLTGTSRTTCASGCTGTPRRRCARPVTTPRGPTRTRTTRTPCTPRSTRPSTTPRCARCSTSWSAQIAPAGWSNSLALKLLSITMPGVPDVYQGSEVEQLSLVDPDNRRPVDFDAAAASLADGSVRQAERHQHRVAAAA